MSETFGRRRFMYKTNSKDRSTKAISETEAILDLKFNDLEEEGGNPARILSRSSHFGTVRKKSTAHKYVTDDNVNWEGATLHRSSSDFGPSFVLQNEDPNDSESLIIPDPLIVRDNADLKRRLEMMHDRCIARNLRAAGLGGFETDRDNTIYGVLDPNARMATGETMLTAAIINIEDPESQARYASILLGEGADVNAKDATGKTSLMHICAGGYERAAKLLFQFEKTDLLIRDEDGNTALMYAAAVGATKILKLYLKALRKYEKVISMTQRSFDESPTLASQSTTMSTSLRDRLCSLSAEDPLDIQNAQGNTARALALKNGHLECANILNEERLRRLKEMNKRLSSINHQRASPTPLTRSAKQAAQKYMSQSSSFDSVYFEQDDRSDDDLMETGVIATGHLLARMEGLDEGDDGKNAKIKKRFQSNPDLFRQRANGSLEAPQEEVEEVCEEDAAGGTKRRQTVQVDLAGLLVEGPITDQPRQHSLHMGRPHRPIIGTPSGPASTASPKKNLSDKLFSFLRRRPKNLAVAGRDLTSPVDQFSSLTPPQPMGTNRRGKPSPNRMASSGGFSIAKSLDEGDEKVEPRMRYLTVGDQDEHGKDPQSETARFRGRKPSPSASENMGATKSLDVRDESQKRRSVDLSFMSAFRNQFLSPKSEVAHVTVTPLVTSASVTQEHFGEVPQELPRLHTSTRASQKRQKQLKARKHQEPFWGNEDACDSGLASSIASTATVSSRPVSAESTVGGSGHR